MVRFAQVQQYPASVLAERAGYFSVPGAHLYTVLHEVEVPLARVLLIGSFRFGASHLLSAMAPVGALFGCTANRSAPF